MKWIKVDYKGEPIIHKKNSWNIPNYISGDFKITNDNGKYTLYNKGEKIGTYKTLKEAKAEAEKISKG